MIQITSPLLDSTTLMFDPIDQTVERSRPHFQQTQGELIGGNCYLFNSSALFPLSIGDDNCLLLLRVDKLSNSTKIIIGQIGCARFDKFLKYENGWDGFDAKKLSLESVAMIELFSANYRKFYNEPSLFLTRKGNLKLQWEDSSGKAVEIEFMPNNFSYYIERIDKDGIIRADEVGKLISMLTVDNAPETA